MIFREALDWLYATQLHGIKLGLQNMERLVEALGIDVRGDTGPHYLHVAGTNGKGSVCAMLDSILRAAGRRTGLFTSPHLISFRERILVDGEMIGEDDVAIGLTRIRELTANWEHVPTFFEITTALALLHFQEMGVELVVLETGLGGRLDATNVVRPCISILTPIDLDHQRFLGRRLAEIALEKAGIIKHGIPAISAPQQEEVLEVLAQVAVERDALFHFVISPLNGAPLALAGEHQRWNAALAVHALDAVEIAVSNEALVRGLATVRWPGRFQRFDEGTIVLDGAHNLGSARQLSRTWVELYGNDEATIIIGVMDDKDLRGICASLAPLARRFIGVAVKNPRAIPTAGVLAAVHQVAPLCEVSAAATVEEAFEAALQHGERVLVTGSLFLVGEALALLEGRTDLERSIQ